MKCTKCQFENPDGLSFCGKCGGELERVCQKYNFSNPLDFMYCGKCGNILKELQTTPPIDYSKPKSYTPKFLADKILTIHSSIEGERKHVTDLFSDLSGYTAMTEKLDPEEVKRIIDQIFSQVAHVVTKYEGQVEKFIGDAVMAVFGIPKAHEDDPLSAI